MHQLAVRSWKIFTITPHMFTIDLLFASGGDSCLHGYKDKVDLSTKLRDETFSQRRIKAIKYIKSICAHESSRGNPQIRDTSIALFDKFLSKSELLEVILFKDIQYAAAAAMLLSFKMYQSDASLVTLSFEPELVSARLCEFQKHFLTIIDFQIYPLSNPSAFLSHFSTQIQCNDHDSLFKSADDIIAEFWEDETSMLYSPSTIAISALLHSMTIHSIIPEKWIHELPRACLPASENNLHVQSKELHPNSKLFEIQECIERLQSILFLIPSTLSNSEPFTAICTPDPRQDIISTHNSAISAPLLIFAGAKRSRDGSKKISKTKIDQKDLTDEECVSDNESTKSPSPIDLLQVAF